MLLKKRPSNAEGGTGRGKRNSTGAGAASNNASVVSANANSGATTPTGTTPGTTGNNQQTALHNGTETSTFLKPDPLPTLTWQEYYEADEILKVLFRFIIILVK
jgi:tousled-like kinase